MDKYPYSKYNEHINPNFSEENEIIDDESCSLEDIDDYIFSEYQKVYSER